MQSWEQRGKGCKVGRSWEVIHGVAELENAAGDRSRCWAGCRAQRAREAHPLGAILGLAVCAMLCGARSLYASASGVETRGRSIGGFVHPAADAVRVHVASGVQQVGGRPLSVSWGSGCRNGVCLKVRRWPLTVRRCAAFRSIARSAHAHQAGIVVGQQAVGEKRNELDAVAGLLGLDLPGRVITGDAQFTQRAVCQRVVAQGGTTSLP